MQEALVLRSGASCFTLAFVGLRQMVMHEWIVRVELQETLVFCDGLIQLAEFQISIGQTILKRIYLIRWRVLL